jgi:ABC-type sugar transport system substrate-binding protein
MTAGTVRPRRLSRFGAVGAVAAFAALASLALAGVGGASSQATNVRVALVLPDFAQNAAILDVKNGAEAQAKKIGGVEVITTGSISADNLVKSFEDAIAADVDVILYDTIDGKAISPAIEKANKAGIPVVCYISCGIRGKHASKIEFDWEAIGRAEGQWLGRTLKAAQAKNGGTPVYVQVDTSKADPAVAGIYKGRNAAIKAAGVSPKSVVTPPTNWDRAKGLNYATDVLTANPRIDAMTCNADSIALSCWQAMKAAGRTDIPFSGANGDCANLSSILKGEQDYSVILFLKSGGAVAMDTAVKVAKGQKYNRAGVVPIQGIDKALAERILSGKAKVPAGLDTLERLKKAKAGCK